MAVLCLFAVAACVSTQPTAQVPPNTPVAAPTPTYAPTSTPQPTAVPRLATDVLVAGVDVGGLEPEQARKKLEDTLTPLLRSLDVEARDTHLTLRPEDIDLQIPLDALIAQAQSAGPGGRVALQVRYDDAKLRAALEGLAKQEVAS